MQTQPKKPTGFTLPELLTTLAVVSALGVAAVSNFTWLLQDNRMVAEVNRFVTALQLARNESVTHARHIVLCPSANGTDCGNSAEWNHGWLLFESVDREYDPGDRLVQRGAPMQNGIHLHASSHRKRIVYQPDGSSGGSNSSFTFCDRRDKAKPRVICLSNTGRPRLTRTRCNGKPVDCSSYI